MLEFTALELNSWVSQYFYAFARIAGCLGVMPLLGSKLVPRQIRILLSVFITFIIAPLLPPMPAVDPMSLASFIIIFEQMLIGIVLGFMVEVVSQVFVLAGQLIAMQTGLGIATTVDPAQGVSVVVVSQWFLFLTSLTFLALNGHLIVIEVVVESFHTMPVGGGAWTADEYGWLRRTAVSGNTGFRAEFGEIDRSSYHVLGRTTVHGCGRTCAVGGGYVTKTSRRGH